MVISPGRGGGGVFAQRRPVYLKNSHHYIMTELAESKPRFTSLRVVEMMQASFSFFIL